MSNQIWPEMKAAYLIDDEVANSADVNKFLTDQTTCDVVARELYPKVLDYCQLLLSDLGPNDRLADCEENQKHWQEADLVQGAKVVLTE